MEMANTIVPETEVMFPVAEKRFYTVPDIQKILGISRPGVYDLLARNEFKSAKVGKRYVIFKNSFEDWLNQH